MTTRIVTFLFTDIEGSTAGLSRQGDSAYSAVLDEHHRIIRSNLQAFDGVEQETRGDSFFAVFSSPSACISAALQMQRDLRAHDWPADEELRVRMGIHTGEASEASTGIVGYEVHRAARIAAVGYGGQVLISSSTMGLVQDSLPPGSSVVDLGSHRLKDLRRPEVIFQLIADELDERFPPLRSLDSPTLNNLPKLVSSFVGRESETAELRTLVSDSRLLTLTGAGGVGKTRLALQVATEELDDYADGVCLVELASSAEPEFVTSTVASSLLVREEPGQPLLETLVNALSDRFLLMVLDNCEHLLVASAEFVDTILRSCPGVSVLATSREPLGIAGERVYRVPSLSVPSIDQVLRPEKARSFDAIQLFVDRATAHLSGFCLDDSNAATVASICRQLDGMPLAIELAAARVSSLSLADIEERLNNQLRLLTGGGRTTLPRHQTLRALVDWSYGLLDEREQEVLCRLSVFAGGWTLEAAEAVCSRGRLEASDVVDILGSLVDKSLVQTDSANGDLRYRLLETIRQYSAERLSQQSSESEEAPAKAHAEFFLYLAEQAGSHLAGGDHAVWFDRLEIEYDNIRNAFAFLISERGSPEDALRLAFALRDFWFCNYLREGSEMLETALERLEANPSRLAASARVIAAYLRFEQGQYRVAQEHFEDVVGVATSLADPAAASRAFGGLGLVASHQGDIATSIAMTDESLRLARTTDDRSVIADAFNNRAAVRSKQGDPGAEVDAMEALSRFRAMDNRMGVARTLQHLAILELKRADLISARSHIEECLEIRRAIRVTGELQTTLYDRGLLELLENDAVSAERTFVEVLTAALRIGDRAFIPFALLGLAFCAGMTNEPGRATTLHGAADHLLKTFSESIDPSLDGFRIHEHRRLRTEMGDLAFDAAYSSGLSLTQDEAVDLALTPSRY